MPAPGYILALLLATGLTLASWLQPVATTWNASRTGSGNLLNLVMGDARRMFANHFFTKADIYFHSGYYPSIFDQGRTNETHIAEQAGTDEHAEHAGHDHEGHDHAEADHEEPEAEVHEHHEHEYLKPPRDWVETFGRNFFNTEHTELTGAGADEILPWLRMSAELDPQRVDTYTVASYWLRTTMNRPKDAEAFLREGQRANPDSYEIILELGRLYRDSYKDTARARNLLQLAERKLEAWEQASGSPDLQAKRQILIALARLEEKAGNFEAAIDYTKKLRGAFPADYHSKLDELDHQIEELTEMQRAKK